MSSLSASEPLDAAAATHSDGPTAARIVTPPLATARHPTASSSGIFTVLSEARIAASPKLVASVLLDFASYPEWNSFVPLVDVKDAPAGNDPASAPDLTILVLNTPLVFHVRMTPSSSLRKSGEILTHVERLSLPRQGYRICWSARGYPDWIMWADRTHEVEDDGSGSSLYTTWETFGGRAGLAHVVKLMVGSNLVERFGDWSRDLKERCEEAMLAEPPAS